MGLSSIFNMFSSDIAIDLGTANTLVHKKQAGIIINEPSVVALTGDGKKVVCIGEKAKEMLGKNPDEVKVVKPLKDGVIADFKVTELMVSDLIQRSQKNRWLIRPRVLVCVPSGITEVEKRAVQDSVLRAGAREVHLVSEPIAAAIGADLPIHKPYGNMVMDIGGGTSEIAVISLSHIANHNSIRLGGEKIDLDIMNYLKKKNNLFIGIQTAEKIKKTIGSAYPLKQELEMEVRGRDAVNGYPVSLRITSNDIRDALSETITAMVDALKKLFEKTSAELAADIAERGIILTGGGALLRGLDEKIKEIIDLPVHVVPDPITCVVRGTGKILDNIDEYKEVLIKRTED
jgi:rod shape-determining protein MreB